MDAEKTIKHYINNNTLIDKTGAMLFYFVFVELKKI